MPSRRCSYYDGRGQCRRKGEGNPPLCADHGELLVTETETEDEFDPIVDAAVMQLMQTPHARMILDSFGGILDSFGAILDRAPPPGSRGKPNKNWERARKAWKRYANARAAAPPPPPRQPGNGHRPPPPPPQPPPKAAKEDPRVIFGLAPGAKLTKEMVKKRYRELAAIYHPDHGGNTEAMQRINVARDDLLASL